MIVFLAGVGIVALAVFAIPFLQFMKEMFLFGYHLRRAPERTVQTMTHSLAQLSQIIPAMRSKAFEIDSKGTVLHYPIPDGNMIGKALIEASRMSELRNLLSKLKGPAADQISLVLHANLSQEDMARVIVCLSPELEQDMGGAL